MKTSVAVCVCLSVFIWRGTAGTLGQRMNAFCIEWSFNQLYFFAFHYQSNYRSLQELRPAWVTTGQAGPVVISGLTVRLPCYWSTLHCLISLCRWLEVLYKCSLRVLARHTPPATATFAGGVKVFHLNSLPLEALKHAHTHFEEGPYFENLFHFFCRPIFLLK